jgi:hypothetical protein
MPDITIKRTHAQPDATFGVLSRDDTGYPLAVTLEREWDGGSNRPSAGDRPGACIPEGTYHCLRVNSPKFGSTFEVVKVPNRSKILFHAGNLADDSRGCILVAHGFDPVKGRQGVVSSKKELEEFLALQANVMGFTLTIRNVW